MKKIKLFLPVLAFLFVCLSSTNLNSAVPFAPPCEDCGKDGEWQGYFASGYYYLFGSECEDDEGNYCNSVQICLLNGPLSDCYQILCLDCIQPHE